MATGICSASAWRCVNDGLYLLKCHKNTLREACRAHEQDGHGHGDVEGESQGERVQNAVEFSQSGMREIAELNLTRKVETCDGCYKIALWDEARHAQ